MHGTSSPHYSFPAVKRALYVVGLVFAFTIGHFSSTSAETGLRPDLTTFWKAWDLAEANFVYRDAIDPQKMMYGAIRGMIDALGDDGHSRFLTPDDVKNERSSLNGRFEGIGAEVNIRNGHPVIVAPLEDSPAEKAGLQPGDAVLAVDGEDVTGATLSDLVTKVRGPRGTSVKLTVLHPNDASAVEVTIVRAAITSKSVSWAIVPGTTVGHVRINRFGPGTTQELKDAIAAAQAAGADRFALDLRNNPGGLLNEAVSTTSQFLKDGDVLLEQNAKGDKKPYHVESGGVATDAPVVVLINRGSASSSEIFAGAIQDHARGQVVGERSFGTGTVLSPFDLGDGSQLYLGVAQWLTPNGRAIRKVGIQPDVPVALAADARALSPREERDLTPNGFAAKNDAQLAKAVALLSPA